MWVEKLRKFLKEQISRLKIKNQTFLAIILLKTSY